MLTCSDLSSWYASGKSYSHWANPRCTSFPSIFRRLDVYYSALSVLFYCHCLSMFFLPPLNCTRQDIAFWNAITRNALITRSCYSFGINRMLSLYWNIVRACILHAVKNWPKLDHKLKDLFWTLSLNLHKFVSIWKLLNTCFASKMLDRPEISISPFALTQEIRCQCINSFREESSFYLVNDQLR